MIVKESRRDTRLTGGRVFSFGNIANSLTCAASITLGGCGISYTYLDDAGIARTVAFGFVQFSEKLHSDGEAVSARAVSVTTAGISAISSPGGNALSVGLSRETHVVFLDGTARLLDDVKKSEWGN